MPTSIIVSVAALGCLLVLNLLLGLLNVLANAESILQPIASLALGGLILWGLIVGHRLAWQWGRILGIAAAALLGFVSFVSIIRLDLPNPGQPPWARPVFAATTLFQSACLIVIFFALGTRGARQHFRLRCPTCGRFSGTASDFFFNRAWCKFCRLAW